MFLYVSAIEIAGRHGVYASYKTSVTSLVVAIDISGPAAFSGAVGSQFISGFDAGCESPGYIVNNGVLPSFTTPMRRAWPGELFAGIQCARPPVIALTPEHISAMYIALLDESRLPLLYSADDDEHEQAL